MVSLQEVRRDLAKDLAGLKELYPYQSAEPSTTYMGVMLLSKKPFSTSKEKLPQGWDFVFRHQIELGDGKSFHLYTVHPLPAVTAENREDRDGGLAKASEMVREDAASVKALMGDFNLTPYSPVFAQVLQTSGLYNSMMGWGVKT